MHSGPLLDDERRGAARAGDERGARAAGRPRGRARELADVERPRRSSPPHGEIRLQWCHGAPGIVVDRRSTTSSEELAARRRRAGLAGRAADREQKGAGICHGTAGNGYALLAAFERTGDEVWLERARRFAAHALGQVERERTALLALDG